MGLLRKKVSKFSLKAAKEDANRAPTPPPQLPPLPGHIIRQEQDAKDAAGPSQQQQRRRSRSLWSGSDEARLAAGSRLGRRGSFSAAPDPGAQPWRSREAWLALHQTPIGAAAAVPTLPVPFGPGGDMPGWRSRGTPGGGFFGTAAELDNTIVRNSENSDGRRTPVPGTPSRRLRSSPSVPSLAPSPSKRGALDFAPSPLPSTPSKAGSSPFTPRAMRRRSRSVDSLAAFNSPAFEFSTPTEGASANSSLLVTPPSAAPTPSLVHSAAERLSPPIHASPLIDDHAGAVLERVDSNSSYGSEHEAESIRPTPSTPSRPSRAPARALPKPPVHAYSEDGHVQHAVPTAFAPRTSLPTRGRASSVTTSVPTVVPVPVVRQAVEAQVEDNDSETDAEGEGETEPDGEVIDFSRPAASIRTTRSRFSGPSSHGHGSMLAPSSTHGHSYASSSHGHGSLPPSAMPANMVPSPQHAQMFPTAVPIEAGTRLPTRTGSASSYRSFRTGGPPSRSTSSAGHSDRDPHANAVPHTPQAIAHAVNVWRQKSKGKEGREDAEKAMNAAQTADAGARPARRVPSFGSIRPRASRADRIEAALRKQAPGGPDHWAANDTVEPHVAADPFAHAGAWEAPNTYSVYGGINDFEPPAPIQTEPLFKPPTRLPQLAPPRPSTPQMHPQMVGRPTTPQMHPQMAGRPTTPQMMNHHQLPRSVTPQFHQRPTTPQMHHRPTTPQMQRPSALPYLPQGQGHYVPVHKTQRVQQPVGQGGWI